MGPLNHFGGLHPSAGGENDQDLRSKAASKEMRKDMKAERPQLVIIIILLVNPKAVCMILYKQSLQ